MSLLKLLAVQLGISGTATNNFTASVPASPDGTMKLARGNSGATTQDLVQVHANGTVQLPNTPTVIGTLSAGTGTNFIQALNAISVSRNMTVDAVNKRLIATVAGWYFVSAQQLVSNTGALYFKVRKNGVEIAHAYIPATGATMDMKTSCGIYLAVGDYIEFYHQGTVTAAWTDAHAPFSVFLIG